MDKRDAVLQASMPTVMMPRHGPLEPSTKMGERVIIAQNGVFLEIKRVWGRFIRPIAPAITMHLPYGNCGAATEWNIAPLPVPLLHEFNKHAAAQCKTEVGASIIWNEVSGYRLAPVQVLESTASHLHFIRAALAPNEHLVVDCHSHARGRAFFSSTDNDDDAFDVKVSYVVGNCDRDEKSTAMRLCLKGIFENLKLEVQ